MSLFSKILPSKSTLISPLKNIPTTKAQITNAVKNPMSVAGQGANTFRDVAASELDRARSLGQGAIDSGMSGIDASRGLAGNAVDVARNGLKSAEQMGRFDIGNGLRTAANGIPMAAQGAKDFSAAAMRQGQQAMGVKLGNALTAQAQQPVINQPQPQVQQQRAFAPQMQMPYNQPIQRGYSGMQFGNIPNPPPPQMPTQPQMMPQYNQAQDIRPQYMQQFGAPPPKNGMGPQQYPSQTPEQLQLIKNMGRPYI